MAGNAQNKLGELFVDIGVGGLGKTLKSLNSVSASFLLTKNAATQLVKPIVNMTHKFGQNAMGLEKMKLTFGTTIEQAQRMQAAFKKLGMEELGSDIQKISDLLTAKDYQGLGENFMAAMSKMQIDISEYNGSLESTLELFDKISDGLSEITKEEGAHQARFWAKQVSSDYSSLMFAKEQGLQFRNLPSIANEMSQEEVNKLIDGEKALINLQQTVFQSMSKIFVDNEEIITKAFKKLAGVAEDAPKTIKKFEKASIEMGKELKVQAPKVGTNVVIGGATGYVGGQVTKALIPIVAKEIAKKMGKKALLSTGAKAIFGGALEAIPGLGTAAGIALGVSTAADIAKMKEIYDDVMKNPQKYVDNNEIKQFEIMPELDALGESNLINNTTINVNQNITSTDPSLAGDESLRKIQEAKNRIAANKFSQD